MDHEWVVFSTAIGTGELMLECVECGAFGTVADATRAEWRRAYFAPSSPYKWSDNDRVILRKEGDGKPHYILRKEA